MPINEKLLPSITQLKNIAEYVGHKQLALPGSLLFNKNGLF